MVDSSVVVAHILSQTRQNIQLLIDHDVLTKESGSAILSKLQFVPGPIERKKSDNPIVDSLTQQTQRLSMSPPQSAGSAPNRKVEGRTKWEWLSNDPKDLSFHAGEIIEIMAETNADWWMGRNRSGKEGMFPSQYVEKLPPRELSPISVTGPSISRTPVNPKGGTGVIDHRSSPSMHALSHPPPAPQQQYAAPNAPPPQAQYAPPPNAPGAQYAAPNAPPPQAQYAPPPGAPGAPRYYHPPGPPQAGPPQVAVNYSYIPPSHAPPAAAKRQHHPTQSSELAGLGHTMAQSAARGLGFGAGSAIGSGVFNPIF